METTRTAKQQYDAARYRDQRDRRDATKPPDPITLLAETDVAYLAGLTDGDGSIYVTHTNRLCTYYPVVTWAMTDRPTIDWVAEQLGAGAVYRNNHTNLPRGETSWGASAFKVQWRTQVSGARAVLLCQRMLPYLRTKRGQAELVARFPADARRAPGVRLSDETRALRVELGEAISALNH